MIIFFVIQAFFVIINIIEAKLESISNKMKNPYLANYIYLNGAEHRWSAIYYMAIVFLFSIVAALGVQVIGWKAGYTLPLLMINRRIFFEYALKINVKTPIRRIGGDQTIDKMVRWILGKNGGWWELLILVSILGASNYFIWH